MTAHKITDRERFESWAETLGLSLQSVPHSLRYYNAETNTAWAAWQQASQPTAPTERPGETEKIADNLFAACKQMGRLEKLPLNHLFTEVLSCSAGDYQCVVELMNRLWPNWQHEEDGVFTEGAPPASRVQPTPEAVPMWAKDAAKECWAAELHLKDPRFIEDRARIIARHAPPPVGEVTALALSLAMFDLAYHRLRNAATRLVLTRRDMRGDFQVAVLGSYLDDLAAIAKETPPTWPDHVEKPAAMRSGREGEKS